MCCYIDTGKDGIDQAYRSIHGQETRGFLSLFSCPAGRSGGAIPTLTDGGFMSDPLAGFAVIVLFYWLYLVFVIAGTR